VNTLFIVGNPNPYPLGVPCQHGKHNLSLNTAGSFFWTDFWLDEMSNKANKDVLQSKSPGQVEGIEKDCFTEGYAEFVSKHPTFRLMQEVVPPGKVWIGPQVVARSPTTLVDNGITHILSVNGFAPFPRAWQSIAKRINSVKMPEFVVKVVHLEDEEDEDLSPAIQECTEFVERGRRSGGVLVYCTAGRSRSASIVTAYLMFFHGLTFQSAINTVRTARPFVKPNCGFVDQLMRMETDLKRSSATHKMHCELCKLERVSNWFVSTAEFVVLECDQCDNPMVVLRCHAMTTSGEITERMAEALSRIATEILGCFYIDKRQRSIHHHLHWHARPYPQQSYL